MATTSCPRCGGPNLPTATICQYCRNPLLGPPPPPNAGGSYRSLPSPTTAASAVGVEPIGPSGVPLLVVGIVLGVIGLMALAAGALVSSGVSTFNRACQQNPFCTPQPDPSGAIYAVGAILLVLGVTLGIYGATRQSHR